MPPLSLIISLFDRLPHCLQYEHGIFKGGLALERMGRGFSRGYVPGGGKLVRKFPLERFFDSFCSHRKKGKRIKS